MTEQALSRLRFSLAELVKLDATPELPLLSMRRARIAGQAGDRVSLQLVDRDGEMPDAGQEARQPIWYGVPGVSATHTPGQETILAFASADAAQPIVFCSTPRGQPGHVPILVRHEASTEIRLVAESAGVVRAGPGVTKPVAIAQAVQDLIAALTTFASAIGVAVPSLSGAATTFNGAAAAAAVSAPATKLEAI